MKPKPTPGKECKCAKKDCYRCLFYKRLRSGRIQKQLIKIADIEFSDDPEANAVWRKITEERVKVLKGYRKRCRSFNTYDGYPWLTLINSIRNSWDPDHPMESFQDVNEKVSFPFLVQWKNGKLYLENSKHRIAVLLYLDIKEAWAYVLYPAK